MPFGARIQQPTSPASQTAAQFYVKGHSHTGRCGHRHNIPIADVDRRAIRTVYGGADHVRKRR
jgi:hypothetical protein